MAISILNKKVMYWSQRTYWHRLPKTLYDMWTTVFSGLPVLTSWEKEENDMLALTFYNLQETTTECVTVSETIGKQTTLFYIYMVRYNIYIGYNIRPHHFFARRPVD